MEAPINPREIEIAFHELQLGKSPGSDRLSAAFYRAFKGEVDEVLYRMLTQSYKEKELPLSFQRPHILLIGKVDDLDKLLSMGSYRLIKLAIIDYNIYIKVLERIL